MIGSELDDVVAQLKMIRDNILTFFVILGNYQSQSHNFTRLWRHS